MMETEKKQQVVKKVGQPLENQSEVVPDTQVEDTEKKYTETDIKNTVNNYVIFAQINAAIEDAIFAQKRLNKDNTCFIKPLLEARNIAKYVLVPALYNADLNTNGGADKPSKN
jgi:hypothetical protein